MTMNLDSNQPDSRQLDSNQLDGKQLDSNQLDSGQTLPIDSSPPAEPVDNALSVVVVTLLKGPLFRDRKPDLWHHLTGRLQPGVRDQASILGLDLVIDDAEGYAFFRSATPDDADTIGSSGSSGSAPPRLMARRPLTFEVSLLLALLRKRLAEFDGSDGHETRLIMTTEEIADLVRLFLPDTTNETKVLDRLNNHLNKIIELGFLRRLDTKAARGGAGSSSSGGGGAGQPVRYEVQRIIKAFVDGQWLSQFDQRLAEYRERLDTND